VRDGSFVKVGTSFEQEWVLENAGFVTWRDRALKQLSSDGLAAGETLVPLPATAPGERASVSVRFTAPDEPASCRSVWQLVAADETVCFPWAPGIWCQVRAVL
jgi:hypothetical protein